MLHKKIIIVFLSVFLILANNKISVASDFPDADGWGSRRILFTGACITVAFLGYHFYDKEIDGWKIGPVIISRKSPYFRYGSKPDGFTHEDSTEDTKNRKSDSYTAPTTPEGIRLEAIENARKAGARLAAAEIQSQAEAAQKLFNDLVELYVNGIIADSAINIAAIKSDPMTGYPLLIESLERLGQTHTELTTQIQIACSPARKPPSNAQSKLSDEPDVTATKNLFGDSAAAELDD